MQIPENTICTWCADFVPVDSEIITNHHGIVTVWNQDRTRTHTFNTRKYYEKRGTNEISSEARGTEVSGPHGSDEEPARQENDADDLAAGLADIFGGTDGESA
jgi:hypothetical protein